jgi:uncharacterized membrane protein YfcA
MRDAFSLVLIGSLAGVLSGLLGVGGGILLIPLLASVRSLTQHELHGTSLGVMIFTASAALLSYAVQGHVPWALGIPLAVGGVGGAPLGSWIAGRFHPASLRLLFAAFLFALGVRMLVPLPRGLAGTGGLPAVSVSIAIGFAIGVLSGLLGVGGGVLLVPVLTLVLHVGQHEAQGASLAMVIPTALSGLIGYVRRRQVRWRFVPWLAPPAAVSAFGGAALAAWLRADRLQQVFGALVMALAVQMALASRARRARMQAGATTTPEAP